MARILSISYDDTLLRTRHLLLESAGHTVTSAVGYHDAVIACATVAELLIIGHSIPKNDKVGIIRCFRDGLVVALTRANEPRLKEVDTYINPGEPEELITAINVMLHPTEDRRLRRIK